MVEFRLLTSTWDSRFIAALRAHYTKSMGPPFGKKLAWEIIEGGCGHRGWVGAGEPAFKLAARRRLGLEDARPRERTVSNFILRLDAPGPSHASEIIRAWHPVLKRDWAARYGWEPQHIETLVDPTEVSSEVPGYSFRRAGYRSLGMTTGRSARRPPGHTHGPRVWSDASPKLVLYFGPLHRLSR